jgi:hypothetical protein
MKIPNIPLEKMTSEELEALRMTWKNEVQQLFTPLIPALLSGYKMSYRQERTRKIGSIICDGVMIDTYDSVKVFDTSKDDFLRRLSIQVFVSKEQVANLVYLYFSKSINAGKWSDETCLFARPHEYNWTALITALIEDFKDDSRSEELKKEDQRRDKLIALLTKGIYA